MRTHKIYSDLTGNEIAKGINVVHFGRTMTLQASLIMSTHESGKRVVGVGNQVFSAHTKIFIFSITKSISKARLAQALGP